LKFTNFVTYLLRNCDLDFFQSNVEYGFNFMYVCPDGCELDRGL